MLVEKDCQERQSFFYSLFSNLFKKVLILERIEEAKIFNRSKTTVSRQFVLLSRMTNKEYYVRWCTAIKTFYFYNVKKSVMFNVL